MSIIIIKLNVSEEQEKAILSRYPDIKYFLEKTISDTIERIIGIAGLNKIDIEEYHERQALNFGVGRMPGQPYWKNRKHSQATKDKISKSLKGRGKGIPQLEETKRKRSLALKGIPLGPMSEEHKKKIGLAHKGMKYKKHKIIGPHKNKKIE